MTWLTEEITNLGRNLQYVNDKRVITLSGFKNSGKSFVAEFFISKGFTGITCASSIKYLIEQLFPFDVLQVWGDSQYRENQVHINWYKVLESLNKEKYNLEYPFSGPLLLEFLSDIFKKYYLSPQFYSSVRDLCLIIGSTGQRLLGKSIWVDLAIKKMAMSNKANFIISDARYEHEILRIKELPREDNQYLKPYTIKLLRSEYWNINNNNPYDSTTTDKDELALMSKEDIFFDLILDIPEGEEKAISFLEDLYNRAPWKK